MSERASEGNRRREGAICATTATWKARFELAQGGFHDGQTGRFWGGEGYQKASNHGSRDLRALKRLWGECT